MNWQNERIIYKTHDEFGDIQITDQALIRTLYFGNDKKQSSMFIPEPAVLVLSYTQAMMSSLLFKENPRRVLIIGLGGASIYHFLDNFYHDCSIDIVEIRRSVIDIATRFFKLPDSKSNLTLYNQDAKEFVSEKANCGDVYDMVFIDAFDQWGPSEIVTNLQFLQHCKKLINKEGICVFNLWNRREDAYGKVLHSFEKVFSAGLLELRLGNLNSNVILMGFAKPFGVHQIKSAANTAIMYKKKFGIDFPHYHKMLEQQNGSIFKRLKRAVSFN